MASSLKPITVRLPEDDLELARAEAEALGISVGVYLRMLFRQSLRGVSDPPEVRRRRSEALRRFGNAMSAEVETQGTTEEDAVRLAREARKRLAAKRRADP